MSAAILNEEFAQTPFLSVSDAVYNVIVKMINCQKLGAGEKLNISALAQDLGISRTPVMAAIARLEEEGIIYTQDKAKFVSALSLEEAAKIHLFRSKLEIAAIRRTAELASKQDTKKFMLINKELNKAYTEDNSEEILHYEAEFHGLIITLCQNPYIIKTYEDLRPQIDRCRMICLSSVDAISKNNQHDFITHALYFSNPSLCAEALLYHLSSVPKISEPLKSLSKIPEPQHVGE